MELIKSAKQVGASKGFDFIISAALGLIFLLCPLFFTGLTSQGLGFEKMVLFYVLVLLGAVAWVSKGVILGELEFKRTPLDWPIVGLLVVFTVSTILSVSAKDSLIGSFGDPTKGLVAVVSFILFYYLLINNLDGRKVKLFFWLFLASGAIITLFSFLQLSNIFVLPLTFAKSISFNPLGSLGALTAFLVIFLPLLVVGATQLEEIQPELTNKAALIFIKIVLGLAILLDLAVLTMLKGFTFWPGALAGIVIVLMFLLAKIIKTTSRNLAIPIVIFLLLIVQLVLGSFNFVTLNLPTEVSLSRSASWDIAKNSVIKNPLFGSGPGTFSYDFAKFKSPDFNNTPLWSVRFNSSTGALFEFMATVGLLGAIAVIVIVLIAFSIIFLALTKTGKKEEQSILLGLFASLVTMLIFALLFLFNSALIIISLILAALATAVAITVYPEKFKSLNLSFRASTKYALALSAIFLFVSAGVVILFTLGFKMYLADVYARQSLVLNDPAQKIDKLTKAVQLAPYQDQYYFELANQYLTLANRGAVGGNDPNVITANLAAAIDMGKKGLDIAPNNAANNEALALVYENASFYVRGALEWAEGLYKKVAELDPQNPTPALRVALINMARANLTQDEKEKSDYINEAVKNYEQAIGKKADLAAAYYGEAIAYEKLTQIDKGIEQLKKAVIFSNNNLDYRFELGRLYFNRGVAKQPSINQAASENIVKEQGAEGELSVSPDRPVSDTISANEDLKTAEQIFTGILAVNPGHANSLYSLALLYQKTNQISKAREMVRTLLNILPEDATKDAVRRQFSGLY